MEKGFIISMIYLSIMVRIGISLCLAPSILTFFLFQREKKKGKFHKYISLIFFLFTLSASIYIPIKIFTSPSGFGPEYDSAIINQKIGGKLLCNSVYTADQHSWDYSVSYNYLNEKGDTIDMGAGCYTGRSWKKNEQLKKLGSWLVLSTGNWNQSDRVILKNIDTDTTIVYNFEKDSIEKDSIWQINNINSLDKCCPEAYIDKIIDDKIILKYSFWSERPISDIFTTRFIYYKIDKNSGQIKMEKIEKQ